MLEKTLKEAEKICNYFDAYLIGSILLRNSIDDKLINNINIAVNCDKYEKINAYLSDNDFDVNFEYEMYNKQKAYIYTKKDYLPIHITFYVCSFSIKSQEEIWADKIMKFSENDRMQLQSMLDLYNKKMMKLNQDA